MSGPAIKLQSAIHMHPDEIPYTENIPSIIKHDCRICLNPSEQKDLISPCNCDGSLKFVHQQCQEQWINTFIHKSKSKIQGKKAHVYCELCKGKISFSVQRKTSCKSKNQVCDKIGKKTKTFVALILLAVANFSFFLALLAYMIRSKGFSNTKSEGVLYPLCIAGEVIFIIVVISCMIILSKKYLLHQRFVVRQILEKREKEVHSQK